MVRDLLFFWALMLPCFVLAESSDPCRGKEMLLNIMNRPTFASSACTVSPRKVFVETGAEYQNVEGGTQQNGPNTTIRVGLSNRTEFLFSPPNHIRQSVRPYSGNTPVWSALKARFYYKKDRVFSGEVFFSPPGGTITFGSPHAQGEVNIIYFKSLTKKISYQLQAGVSSFCLPEISGGNCFQSFNPDLVLNYNLSKKLVLYYENVAQTKSSSDSGFGMYNGLGLLYLLRPSLVFDMEYYHRISGSYNAVDFYGLGLSKLFS